MLHRQGKEGRSKGPPIQVDGAKRGSLMPVPGVASLAGMGKSVAGENSTFLFPANYSPPPRTAIDEATGFVASPLGVASFVSNLRLILSMSPSSWPVRPVQDPTSRSLKRSLANIAQLMNLPIQGRLPLGVWQGYLENAESAGRFCGAG